MDIDVSAYKRQVKGPGQFEGEPPETAYFYDQWLNGDGESYSPDMGDDDDDEGDDYGDTPEATLFQISAEESEAFDLEVGDWFILWEDGQGFVYGNSYESRTEAEESFDEWLGV